ncbi:ogfod2 [Symbiodinium pilosum]|uniref:Ogfod2 protein n=1 Tax=Symbiodinium pilosum TaxID=2952 RepID=A0A812TSH0_SYMPI|nr:ogfod2 [Symbiodinium pilosum]
MAELMKLEANLSVALGEKPTVWSSCPSDCSKLDPAIQHFTSLSAQSSVDMQDRTIGVVTEEFESESPVEIVPPMKSQSRSTRAVGTTTDDLAGLSEENVKDVSLSQSQTSSSPDTTAKKERSDTARSAPSRSGSGRVSALLSAPPVSARLSLRRQKEPKASAGRTTSPSAKLRRSSSARELSGPVSGLLASDVARLVASPEIGATGTVSKGGHDGFTGGYVSFPDVLGTLNDFLPHPTPEPEACGSPEEMSRNGTGQDDNLPHHCGYRAFD